MCATRRLFQIRSMRGGKVVHPYLHAVLILTWMLDTPFKRIKIKCHVHLLKPNTTKKKKRRKRQKKQKMISPRIELGTFCVLSRCHNQLDHETSVTKDPRASGSRERGELGIEPRASRMLVSQPSFPGRRPKRESYH